jgi:hypothetical protein
VSRIDAYALAHCPLEQLMIADLRMLVVNTTYSECGVFPHENAIDWNSDARFQARVSTAPVRGRSEIWLNRTAEQARVALMGGGDAALRRPELYSNMFFETPAC